MWGTPALCGRVVWAGQGDAGCECHRAPVAVEAHQSSRPLVTQMRSHSQSPVESSSATVNWTLVVWSGPSLIVAVYLPPKAQPAPAGCHVRLAAASSSILVRQISVTEPGGTKASSGLSQGPWGTLRVVTERRRMLTVRISDEARSAIDAYCTEHGVSITAWIEALGRRVQQLRSGDEGTEALRVIADETVGIARIIDKERRARVPDS